jgi:predicted short-subunit dehydrogenase-like oxidoreductase (DUF2520 family)
MAAKRTITLVGAGRLAGFLAPALVAAGYKITEIVAQPQDASLARARTLARKVYSRTVTPQTAKLNASVLWLAVPDSEIHRAALEMARRIEKLGSSHHPRFAFHSSGALGSVELTALHEAGLATASVHALMTFVGGPPPSLAGVPFAIEGDPAAVSAARAIARELGGESFVLPPRLKPAYHAWATMTSPLLLAYLVALERAARQAGFSADQSRRMALPILRQTLNNYTQLGPAASFSGPFVRGDVATVEKHLSLLKRNPSVKAVYEALARVALNGLPVKNRSGLVKLFED